MLYATAWSKRQAWDDVIGNVVLALRASKNLAIFPLFEVIYGFTPKLDIDHSTVNENESCLHGRERIVEKSFLSEEQRQFRA